MEISDNEKYFISLNFDRQLNILVFEFRRQYDKLSWGIKREIWSMFFEFELRKPKIDNFFLYILLSRFRYQSYLMVLLSFLMRVHVSSKL